MEKRIGTMADMEKRFVWDLRMTAADRLDILLGGARWYRDFRRKYNRQKYIAAKYAKTGGKKP